MQDNMARGLALKALSKISGLPNGYRSLGSVEHYSDLPASNNKVGDSYTVQHADDTHASGRYVWGKSKGSLTWYHLDGDNDYVSEKELDDALEKTVSEIDRIKTASVSEDGKTLTLKNQDDEETTFTAGGGDGHLYIHNITLNYKYSEGYVIFRIVTSVDSEYDIDSLFEYLSSLVPVGKYYFKFIANGYCKVYSKYQPVMCVEVSNTANEISVKSFNSSGYLEGLTVTKENITAVNDDYIQIA